MFNKPKVLLVLIGLLANSSLSFASGNFKTTKVFGKRSVNDSIAFFKGCQKSIEEFVQAHADQGTIFKKIELEKSVTESEIIYLLDQMQTQQGFYDIAPVILQLAWPEECTLNETEMLEVHAKGKDLKFEII